MSPIDRKVRKRAKAMSSRSKRPRSDQSENPAFRALVDKLYGTKLDEPKISASPPHKEPETSVRPFFKDYILKSVTAIYDLADLHDSNVYGGRIDGC